MLDVRAKDDSAVAVVVEVIRIVGLDDCIPDPVMVCDSEGRLLKAEDLLVVPVRVFGCVRVAVGVRPVVIDWIGDCDIEDEIVGEVELVGDTVHDAP